MFNSLTGTITGKFPNTIYIETHGIEWDVTVPTSTLDAVASVGQEARIYTWLYFREDAMKLFGFSSVDERSLFLDLLKVDGVGAKGAVKIMSHIAASQFISALDSSDLAALEKVPGIGKKTAAKILLTLKGKLSLENEIQTFRSVQSSIYGDVVTSLVNMGYDKRDCEQVIERIGKSLAQEKDFENKTQTVREELVFRRALVELAQ